MSAAASRHPLEAALSIGLRRLIMWAVPLSLLALVFPAPEPDEGLLLYSIAHLTVVQVVAFLFTIELTPLTDDPWFDQVRLPWLVSTASLVATVVGFSALLTLATAAAARYDPSMQFLQLLSSLDIAWVVAALYIGARRLWGTGVGLLLGSVILAACVGSIALYLQTVGFTPDGGWLVDGSAMRRIVLPADMVAAVLSLVVLLSAARVTHRTAQAKPQS